MAHTKHGYFIPGSTWEEKVNGEPKITGCGGQYFCRDCSDDVNEWRRENVLGSNDPDSGAGWFEFIHPFNATTHIAYVRENGEVYLPEAGLTKDDLILASVRGQAYRLVRADDVSEL